MPDRDANDQITNHAGVGRRGMPELRPPFPAQEGLWSKPTVINLTNHAYWNLEGQGSGLGQEVEMPADHYLPLQGPKLPTGEIRDVTGTAFDFRKLRRVGEPYDACFCLNGPRGTLRKGRSRPGNGFCEKSGGGR